MQKKFCKYVSKLNIEMHQLDVMITVENIIFDPASFKVARFILHNLTGYRAKTIQE